MLNLNNMAYLRQFNVTNDLNFSNFMPYNTWELQETMIPIPMV